jgi:hypothetical protein
LFHPFGFGFEQVLNELAVLRAMRTAGAANALSPQEI